MKKRRRKKAVQTKVTKVVNLNDFVIQLIKFIRNRFPEFDRFNTIYQLDETDIVKIKGDLESF